MCMNIHVRLYTSCGLTYVCTVCLERLIKMDIVVELVSVFGRVWRKA